MADPDGMRCEPITDESGKVVAVARVSGALGEHGRAALLALVAAVTRQMEADDVADPSRVERREQAARRNAERLRRVRGESK